MPVGAFISLHLRLGFVLWLAIYHFRFSRLSYLLAVHLLIDYNYKKGTIKIIAASGKGINYKRMAEIKELTPITLKIQMGAGFKQL